MAFKKPTALFYLRVWISHVTLKLLHLVIRLRKI